jgi:hypothetical protein
MPTVNIVRGFTYQHPDGYKEEIPPGRWEMEEAMANQRYVRGFSDDPLPPRFSPGHPAYSSALASYEAGQRITSVQENQVADEAAQNARHEFRQANEEVQQRRPNQRARPSEEGRAQIDPGAASPGEEHAPEGSEAAPPA